MGAFRVSYRGKQREACRRAVRAYCVRVGKSGLVPPCWSCPLIKGGLDCKGNSIGTREAKIAEAVSAVLELPTPQEISSIPTFSNRKETKVR